MGVMALTSRQRKAVAVLVQERVIEVVGSGGDERKARSFLANADAAHGDMRRVKTALVRHDLAYAVMHDVGEAMLAAYGYRTVFGAAGTAHCGRPIPGGDLRRAAAQRSRTASGRRQASPQ